MPYPEMMVAPMREDLVRVGFTEMRTPEEVDAILGTEKRTTLVAVNSVCGWRRRDDAARGVPLDPGGETAGKS